MLLLVLMPWQFFVVVAAKTICFFLFYCHGIDFNNVVHVNKMKHKTIFLHAILSLLELTIIAFMQIHKLREKRNHNLSSRQKNYNLILQRYSSVA